MKRFISLMICLATLLSITGCKGDSDVTIVTSSTTSTSTSSSKPESLPTEPSEPSEAPDNIECVHEFEEVARQDSTCTKEGYIDYCCRLCGFCVATELEPTGHRFMDATCAVPKICSQCGIADGKELGHHYAEGQNTCSRCGTTPPAPDCEHSYQLSASVSAGCTTDGSVTYTCSGCGYHYSAPVPAKGHTFLNATCLEAKKCSVCGATEGKPLGHQFGGDYLCTRCGMEDPYKPVDTPDEPLDPDELPPLSFFCLTIRAKNAPVSGITVTVYVDGNTSASGSAKTDSNGKISISLMPGSSYKIVLSDVPSTYEYKESYTFTSLNANLNLTLAPVLNSNDHSKAQYKVGSTMADFTLTDTNGNQYTLSELLKTKDVVILNFWYVSCVPCKNEFPYFEEVYQQFDNVQFLALSHMDSESSIRKLQSDMGLTFPMIRENIGMRQGFSLEAYPTTVVIGKNMEILKIHTGAYSRDEVLELFTTYGG